MYGYKYPGKWVFGAGLVKLVAFMALSGTLSKMLTSDAYWSLEQF